MFNLCPFCEVSLILCKLKLRILIRVGWWILSNIRFCSSRHFFDANGISPMEVDDWHKPHLSGQRQVPGLVPVEWERVMIQWAEQEHNGDQVEDLVCKCHTGPDLFMVTASSWFACGFFGCSTSAAAYILVKPLGVRLAGWLTTLVPLVRLRCPAYQHLQQVALLYMALSVVEFSHILISPFIFYIVSDKAGWPGSYKKRGGGELWLFMFFLLCLSWGTSAVFQGAQPWEQGQVWCNAVALKLWKALKSAGVLANTQVAGAYPQTFWLGKPGVRLENLNL